MRIAVLLKEVPDPDGEYFLDNNGKIDSQKLIRLPGIFDENALEAALQIAEENQGEVTVFSFGSKDSVITMRHCYAMGANEVVLIEDDLSKDYSPYVVALILSESLKQKGPFDLILAGRESSDFGNGLVGPLVAKHLDIPFLTLIRHIELTENKLKISRLANGGYDIFQCGLPMLLTITSEEYIPRYPSVLKVLKAKKREIKQMSIEDLGINRTNLDSLYKTSILDRSVPVVEGKCQFIEGDTVAEMARDLIEKLSGEGLI